MGRIYLKQGDLLPALVATVQDEAGTALDLSGVSSVSFSMKNAITNQSAISNGSAAIYGTAANGQIQYVWQSGDTNRLGDYIGEFKLTWVTAQPQSVPHKVYVYISIEPSIS